MRSRAPRHGRTSWIESEPMFGQDVVLKLYPSCLARRPVARRRDHPDSDQKKEDRWPGTTPRSSRRALLHGSCVPLPACGRGLSSVGSSRTSMVDLTTDAFRLGRIDWERRVPPAASRNATLRSVRFRCTRSEPPLRSIDRRAALLHGWATSRRETPPADATSPPSRRSAALREPSRPGSRSRRLPPGGREPRCQFAPRFPVSTPSFVTGHRSRNARSVSHRPRAGIATLG